MFGYRQLGVYVQRDKLLEHVFGVEKKAQENLEKTVGDKPGDV